MAWLPSAVCLALGTILGVISVQLIQFPDTEMLGIILGAVGVGLIAASQYLQEHGFKAMFKFHK